MIEHFSPPFDLVNIIFKIITTFKSLYISSSCILKKRPSLISFYNFSPSTKYQLCMKCKFMCYATNLTKLFLSMTDEVQACDLSWIGTHSTYHLDQAFNRTIQLQVKWDKTMYFIEIWTTWNRILWNRLCSKYNHNRLYFVKYIR